MMKIEIHIDRNNADPERSQITDDIIGDEMDQEYIQSLLRTLKYRIGTAAGVSREELKQIRVVIDPDAK